MKKESKKASKQKTNKKQTSKQANKQESKKEFPYINVTITKNTYGKIHFSAALDKQLVIIIQKLYYKDT